MPNRQLSDSQMLVALSDRDASFDGQFFYGVITTGIFCKPSCTSRTPRPENIRYFSRGGEAAAGGYRACKRCHPLAKNNADVIAIARHIDANVGEKLLLEDLAGLADMSAGHLQKKFKAAFGLSPRQYHALARVNQLKSELRGPGNVSSAIYAAGYGSSSRVYSQAEKTLGMTPARYQDGGQGEQIRYASRKTDLGLLMIAATERGVCFAQFGDTQAELTEQLADEFPKADLQRSSAENSCELNDWIAAINESLKKAIALPELPLDLRGTAFQLLVWQFLLSIREGDVVSYTDVAAAIDRPKAVRAAASACASNRIALLVPCHRVLRSDGSLGGYRWGLEMKRQLLDQERLAVAGQG